MTAADQLRLTVAIDEMLEAHRRVHRRTNAGKISLVAILERDVERDDDTAPKPSGGGLSGGFESRPPGHYAPRELLDALNRDLDLWRDWFGLEGWASTIDKLRDLRDTAPDVEDDDTMREAARELERWADRLRRYAGLSRIYRPRATCPQCEKLGTLTVWIDEAKRAAETAKCHQCGATWDSATIGVLLAHIKGEIAPGTTELVHTSNGEARAS
jgi:hypothetical protein